MSTEMHLHNKIASAIDTIEQYGGVDGAHHKQWVIDKVLRILLGDNYDEWVARYEQPQDSEEMYYEWDEGIAP